MKKVIVAMSGGVDSSVAATILKNRGYNVVGVFMKFFTPTLRRGGDLQENKCCSLEAKLDAKRVAVKLGIPFYVIDTQKEFKKKVFDYFINEYKQGNTPNPCVECNRHIKFKILFDKMVELKADYIATGHYARLGREIRNPKSEIRKLLVARDKAKDQSYFLWQLNQKQLSKILFPIGDYTKIQVREMAKEFKLPVYNKKDSQEICFVNELNSFLKRYIKTKPGQITTVEGKKVGEHQGLAFYTIGQRKGIEIGGTGPYYVIRKDFKKNTLIVAQSNFNEALYKKEMTMKKVNWLNEPSKFPFKCIVKIRSTAKMVDATIKRNKIIFNKPQRAITSGQSAVFYKGNQLIGGGVIM